MKNGYDADRLRDAAVGGVSSAMGAIFILLAVGALIGTWNMAGTIPTVVSYGVAILKPSIFFAAVAVICALVGAVTGAPWTTAGTLGVAFVGMAPVLGLSTSIAAGAVISGAYVGDKMSPLSETTILVPTLVGGVSVTEHIKGMVATVAPAFAVAIVIYLGHRPDRRRGRRPDQRGGGASGDRGHLLDQPRSTCCPSSPSSSSPSARSRLPHDLPGRLGTGVLACITQPDVVDAFVGGDAGRLRTSVEAAYAAMGSGFESTGERHHRRPVQRGRHGQDAATVWLILAASASPPSWRRPGSSTGSSSRVVRRASSAAGPSSPSSPPVSDCTRCR